MKCSVASCSCSCSCSVVECSVVVVVVETATKPSRFSHFWQAAQSRAPATRNEIWTSKSGPNPSVFSTFDFEICFAPQHHALFQHLNREVPLTFSLANLLRATAACNFWSLIWPEGSAPATLASLLFDPPGPQIIGKTPFRAPRSSFFWLLLFADLLSSSRLLFCSLLFSDSSHPCFSSVHIVGNLTSKLPSITKI